MVNGKEAMTEPCGTLLLFITSSQAQKSGASWTATFQ